ncbi:MAG TPA: ATP-binding cassette domain-containing protein [bacterium]|nr:ATP-binding cassette domain-containing protein [bacterium]
MNGAAGGGPALDGAIAAQSATLALGPRRLWEALTFTVPRGEFLVVLGPNGAGKTSLLRVLLGLQRLTSGSVLIDGHLPRRGDPRIGYVAQYRAIDPDLPVLGRDLVGFGLDGHRWGGGLRSRASAARIEEALDLVGARSYADTPVGRLSGGEQQRLRIAQALVSSPGLLLCDEPLQSLDLYYQRVVVEQIADWNRRRGATVVFVTHDINPVLSAVNRVLLLAPRRWALGAVDEVLTAETLGRLYDAPVDVLRHEGRLVIVGADLGAHETETAAGAAHHHHHHA